MFWLLWLELWETSPILTSDSLSSENFTIGLTKIKGLMWVLLSASAQLGCKNATLVEANKQNCSDFVENP